jgi:hypothetical protein
MEPVCNSFAGACFPLVLVLSAAKMPNTRIKAATMLNTARRPALRSGMARGFRIGNAPRCEGFNGNISRKWILYDATA